MQPQTIFSIFDASATLAIADMTLEQKAQFESNSPIARTETEKPNTEILEKVPKTKEIKRVYPPGLKRKQPIVTSVTKYKFTLVSEQEKEKEETLLGFDLEFYRRKWHQIHTKGADVIKGKLSARDFCIWMRQVPASLPCSICSNHAREYMTVYPPERASNTFDWTWQFHNEVNRRKNKPIVSHSEAAAQYGL
jgi:hypothetical protein